MEEVKENHDIIKKAYGVIKSKIVISPLQDNEKNALNMLVDKLIIYYDKRVELLAQKGIDMHSTDERVSKLLTLMTDILVDINNVIKGGIDIYYFVSVISKRINDKDIEKMVKVKTK